MKKGLGDQVVVMSLEAFQKLVHGKLIDNPKVVSEKPKVNIGAFRGKNGIKILEHFKKDRTPRTCRELTEMLGFETAGCLNYLLLKGFLKRSGNHGHFHYSLRDANSLKVVSIQNRVKEFIKKNPESKLSEIFDGVSAATMANKSLVAAYLSLLAKSGILIRSGKRMAYRYSVR